MTRFWPILAVLAFAACGTHFTASKGVQVSLQASSGIVSIIADGSQVCSVKSPKAIPFKVVCDPGEIAWYDDTGTAACLKSPCPAAAKAHYGAGMVTCDAE